MNEEQKDLMLDLLIKEAVYGLNEDERRQLTELEGADGSAIDTESLALTAAMLSMSGIDKNSELPKNLENRIMADAERYFDSTEANQVNSSIDAVERKSGFAFPSWLGWAVAAAACIALAFNLFITRSPQTQVVQAPTPSPEENLSPGQLRQRLIDSAPDLARAFWAPGNVEAVKPGGDVVWSDEKQAGYMRLQGLPENDPSQSTYQLWIFDETQDDKTPIDGGTFNVNSDGEVIVPINAKLEPRNTKMFAITVEKPGGVVVSKREKIVALAKRET
jgi:anti-sigma-K factor RskA